MQPFMQKHNVPHHWVSEGLNFENGPETTNPAEFFSPASSQFSRKAPFPKRGLF